MASSQLSPLVTVPLHSERYRELDLVSSMSKELILIDCLLSWCHNITKFADDFHAGDIFQLRSSDVSRAAPLVAPMPYTNIFFYMHIHTSTPLRACCIYASAYTRIKVRVNAFHVLWLFVDFQFRSSDVNRSIGGASELISPENEPGSTSPGAGGLSPGVLALLPLSCMRQYRIYTSVAFYSCTGM